MAWISGGWPWGASTVFAAKASFRSSGVSAFFSAQATRKVSEVTARIVLAALILMSVLGGRVAPNAGACAGRGEGCEFAVLHEFAVPTDGPDGCALVVFGIDPFVGGAGSVIEIAG